MALLSPGIEMKETSINSTVVRSATGRAALVGKFAWGPAYEIRQVTNEVELVDMFGSPDNVTAPYFMSAMNFLQYGNDLRLVR
ncbi:phage tail sheath subtilisin-like domain-containing protein, partial [Salmonella enterica]